LNVWVPLPTRNWKSTLVIVPSADAVTWLSSVPLWKD
jgi:hypothetical protein